MVAVVLVLIIVAMVTAMSFLSVSNTTASGGHMSSAQALFAANSGLERALFQFSKLDASCAALTNTNLSISATNPGSFTTSGTVYPTAATSSTLSGAITAAATIIPVTSTANFAPHGRILIESEEIDYSSTSNSAAVCGTAPCFIAEKRGENGTTAAAHASAVAVYQPTQCLIQSTGTAGSAKRVLQAVVRDLSVQSGSVALAVLTDPQSVPVTINPVNPNRSFVVCQNRQNDSHNDTRITCELTNPATLTITNGGTSGNTVTAVETVTWYVVEFISGVTVQRGLAGFASGTATVNVTLPTAVNLASAVVVNSERFGSNSQSNDERWTTTAQLTSTTNLQLVRNVTGTAMSAAWQVIQMNNATVQRNASLLTIPQSGTSVTGTLSPALNAASTIVVVTRRAGSATAGVERYYHTRAELTNTTTATFTRAFQDNTSNTQVDMFWYAVQISDATVQRCTACPSFVSTVNVSDIALSPTIVPSRSLPLISMSGHPVSGAGATGDLDDLSWTAAFTSCAPNCTYLELSRAPANTTATIAWFVVTFAPQISVVDRVESYP